MPCFDSVIKWNERKEKVHILNTLNACVYTTFFCCYIVYADIKFVWSADSKTRNICVYICPCKKHIVSRSKPQNSKDWPQDLLMEISNANKTGKCKILN